ncbi:hypothetical protein FRC01_006254 [Tulasnella sp. 417]|nr:hypothetical protein FRC01_006254 [Tulasnella sp. 417]
MEPFPHSQTVASQAAAQAAIQRLGLAIGSNANGGSPSLMMDQSSVGSLASGNNRESIKKDPDFWVPETVPAVVFQAGDVLFRIVPWTFHRNSDPLWDLCELGRVAETKDQDDPAFTPNSETNPLIIRDTGAEEFRALMKWMDPHHHSDGQLTPQDYQLILPAAHRWDVRKAFLEAVAALHPHRFTMLHTERLCIAIMYDIPDWIRTTLEGLIRSNENLSEEDEQRLTSINPAAYRELMATRNNITQNRHKLLIRPPKVIHADDCSKDANHGMVAPKAYLIQARLSNRSKSQE